MHIFSSLFAVFFSLPRSVALQGYGSEEQGAL